VVATGVERDDVIGRAAGEACHVIEVRSVRAAVSDGDDMASGRRWVRRVRGGCRDRLACGRLPVGSAIERHQQRAIARHDVGEAAGGQRSEEPRGERMDAALVHGTYEKRPLAEAVDPEIVAGRGVHHRSA